MSIRPVDLPEIRAELSEQISNLKFVRPLRHLLKEPFEGGIEQAASALQDLVNEATLYHVAEPMTNLVATATDSLDVFTPTREDLPSAQGLIIFDGDLKQHLHIHDGGTPALRGMLWGSSGKLPFFAIAPITEKHPGVPTPGRLVVYPSLMFKSRYGEDIDRAHECQNVRLLALLLTASILMRQPLAEETTEEPDRAARKRLRRAGHKPASVRVIELRRPKTTAGSPSESGREYHHRWITRGHWRQQWFPKREVHRPVWIAPHIKGPEGAPLIGGEKVYALKR